MNAHIDCVTSLCVPTMGRCRAGRAARKRRHKQESTIQSGINDVFLRCCWHGPLWHFPLFLQSLFLTSNSMWGWWGFFTSGDSAQHCCIQPPLLVQSLSQYALRLSKSIIWNINCLETGYVWYEIGKYEFKNLFIDKCSSFSKSDSSANFLMYLCPCFL